MAWLAVVYSDEGIAERISCGKKKSLFERCQSRYGHCLGKITDSAGDSMGWRFAKCNKDKECVPTIYEIRIREEI